MQRPLCARPETAPGRRPHGFQTRGLCLDMAAVPLSGRRAHGLAPPAPACGLRSPGCRELPQVPLGVSGRTPRHLHRTHAPGVSESRIVDSWPQLRRGQSCGRKKGSLNTLGWGKSRQRLWVRPGWAVPATILPGALHPQPGCRAAFPAETRVLRSPGHTPRAEQLPPPRQATGRCVWEKVAKL